MHVMEGQGNKCAMDGASEDIPSSHKWPRDFVRKHIPSSLINMYYLKHAVNS